jgi:hypothetical protein
MVMGDLVLTMTEVDPVMRKLIENGIEVTALHNHLLRTQPFTMYMHVLGHGDPIKMAGLFHDVLVENKMPFADLTIGLPPPPRRRSISTQPPSIGRSALRVPITAASIHSAYRARSRSASAG